LVLTNCIERIIHNNQYADRDLGVNLVRGESVVMLGEVVRHFFSRFSQLYLSLFQIY
jgi:hypothetical protein